MHHITIKSRNLLIGGNRHISHLISCYPATTSYIHHHISNNTSYTCITSSYHPSRRFYHASNMKSASKRDYYEVLGIGRSSSKDDIKKKYRELAKKYHPDLNKDDKSALEKFKEINEAYEILSDDGKKQMYDSYGHQGVDGGAGDMGGNPFAQGFGGGGFGGFNAGGFEFRSGSGNIDAEDIFEMFGMKMRPQNKGKDVQLSARLSFLEAVNGCTRELKYDYVLRESNRSSGVRKSKTAKVEIPAGVDSGQTIKVTGMGEDGLNNKPPGDLYITVDVTSDAYFRRDGYDVHVDIPISITQAMIGGTAEVLTLDGLVDLKIPAGTQPDSKLVMRGKGIKRLDSMSRRGNQIVNLKVSIPKKLTDRQVELIKEFDAESNPSSSSSSSSSCSPRSFSLDQAWKRLKEYMSKSSPSSDTDNKDKKQQTETQSS